MRSFDLLASCPQLSSDVAKSQVTTPVRDNAWRSVRTVKKYAFLCEQCGGGAAGCDGMRRDAAGFVATYVVGVGRGLVVLGRGLGQPVRDNKNAWQSVHLLKSTRFWAGGANSAAGCDGMRREG